MLRFSEALGLVHADQRIHSRNFVGNSALEHLGEGEMASHKAHRVLIEFFVQLDEENDIFGGVEFAHNVDYFADWGSSVHDIQASFVAESVAPRRVYHKDQGNFLVNWNIDFRHLV